MIRSTKSLTAAISCAFCILAFGSSSSADTLPPRDDVTDGLAAFVNGEPITIGDVSREMPRWMREEVATARPGADPRDLWRSAFRKALSALEDKTLVLQKYRASDVRIPEHAVDRAVASVLENRFDGNRQRLLADLAERKLSWEEWRRGMEEEIIVASMKNLYVDGNAAVSPNEVTREYERLRDERYSRPARVRVRLAALPGDEAAASFLARLRAGESFAELARALSTESHAAQGGDCGLVTPEDEFAPAICAALAALPEGGVSEPVAIGSQRYVVMRGETEEAGLKTLSEVWDELRAELVARRKDELFRIWIGHLRDAADIREFLPFDGKGDGAK